MNTINENEPQKERNDTGVRLNRRLYQFCTHWLTVFNAFIFVWVGLPFLAPLFMRMGWEKGAAFIHIVYTAQCHQLPQRSFFLFGDKMMYALPEIQSVWQNTTDPRLLRSFIGTAEMGWKVAWSDRMVYMYGALLLFSLLYQWRPNWRQLPFWGLILFLLPMAIDGGSHMVSDIMSGFSIGFRETNVWLAELTNYAFEPTFYNGDALGSFNAWMRFISGVTFGLGIVWWGYPILDEQFQITAEQIAKKFSRANISL